MAQGTPDWWRNEWQTGLHPAPTQFSTAVAAGQTVAQNIIGVPPGGQGIRLWRLSMGVLATAGNTGYIICSLGTLSFACQVGESVNADFSPVGLWVPGTGLTVTSVVGTVYYTVSALYDLVN